jgi:hypothetical protein
MVPKIKITTLTRSIVHSFAVESIKLPRLRMDGTHTPTKIPSSLCPKNQRLTDKINDTPLPKR